jgi:hypothetical protein
MHNDVFKAIAARITEEPRLYGEGNTRQQAAFRARVTGLKLLEKAANLPDFDEWAMEDAFKLHGMRLIRSTAGRSIITELDGLEVRQAIIKALKTYMRPIIRDAYEQREHARRARRPTEKKKRIATHDELVSRCIDLTLFRNGSLPDAANDATHEASPA